MNNNLVLVIAVGLGWYGAVGFSYFYPEFFSTQWYGGIILMVVVGLTLMLLGGDE